MNSNYDVNIKHLCNGIIHPDTSDTITKYKKLNNDPAMIKIWTTAFGNEYGRMAQGDNKTFTKVTNSIFAMSHYEIDNIP